MKKTLFAQHYLLPAVQRSIASGTVFTGVCLRCCLFVWMFVKEITPESLEILSPIFWAIILGSKEIPGSKTAVVGHCGLWRTPARTSGRQSQVHQVKKFISGAPPVSQTCLNMEIESSSSNSNSSRSRSNHIYIHREGGTVVSNIFFCVFLSGNTLTPEPFKISLRNFLGIILWS